jgi:hypothetical protein
VKKRGEKSASIEENGCQGRKKTEKMPKQAKNMSLAPALRTAGNPARYRNTG